MKPFVFAVLMVLTLSTNSAAQGPEAQPHTTSPTDARFEVLPAVGSGGQTLRLDRWTGRIAVLRMSQDEAPTWEDCEILDMVVALGGRPRFQLFTSASRSGNTFLIDADSGKSWVMTYVQTDRTTRSYTLVWEPFVEKPK